MSLLTSRQRSALNRGHHELRTLDSRQLRLARCAVNASATRRILDIGGGSEKPLSFGPIARSAILPEFLLASRRQFSSKVTSRSHRPFLVPRVLMTASTRLLVTLGPTPGGTPIATLLPEAHCGRALPGRCSDLCRRNGDNRRRRH